MKKVKKLLQILIYLAVVFFVYFLIRDNLDQLRDYQIKNWGFLGLSVVFYFIHMFINAFAWNYLMKKSGEPLSLWTSINVYISSYIVRYIPGKVFELVSRVSLNKELGVKSIKTAWGWVVEKLGFLLVGLSFSLPLAWFLSKSLTAECLGDSCKYISPQCVILLVCIAFVVFAVLLFRYEILQRIFKLLVAKKYPKLVDNHFEDLDLSVRKKIGLLGIFFVSWIFYSVNFVLVYTSVMGFDSLTSGSLLLNILKLLSINAAAWSIGFISIITPSGAGVRESILLLATGLLFSGVVSEADSLVITILARLSFIAGEFVFLGFVKLINLIKNNNEK